MLSYLYRKSHCGDKTILRLSYLHNGISYTGKMTSLYWIRFLLCCTLICCATYQHTWPCKCSCCILMFLLCCASVMHQSHCLSHLMKMYHTYFIFKQTFSWKCFGKIGIGSAFGMLIGLCVITRVSAAISHYYIFPVVMSWPFLNKEMKKAEENGDSTSFTNT